ncbi:hypothetical protein Tco_1168106 [Tanacetum coccineum]
MRGLRKHDSDSLKSVRSNGGSASYGDGESSTTGVSNATSVITPTSLGESLTMNPSNDEVSSWLINETNIETLFGVKFTSLSDIDVFSMSMKEGKYADIMSTMSSVDIDDDANAIETIRMKF